MNEYIKLRQQYLSTKESLLFPIALLKEFKKKETLTANDQVKTQKIETILNLKQQELSLDQMIDLLEDLGKDPYMNRYIVDLFIAHPNHFRNPIFHQRFVNRVKTNPYHDLVLYSLLDSSIELDYPLADHSFLVTLLDDSKLPLDNFAIIIDYIDHFQLKKPSIAFEDYLSADYPLAIKVQLIDLYLKQHPLNAFKELVLPVADQEWIKEYLEMIQKRHTSAKNDFTILQSMFYGDFENSGKGNNGGLGVFLKTLGNGLAQEQGIDCVLSLSITDQWLKQGSFVRNYGDKHLALTLPLFADPKNPNDFLKKQHFIKRTVKRFLNKLELVPDVYHVRFLDNASMAIANLAKDQNKKLVVTLTPDPHRNMTTQTGALRTFTFDELMYRLNKIIIGEELISESDQVVGIGNQVVKKELAGYFPQTTQGKYQDTIRMINEGIQLDLNSLQLADSLMTDTELSAIGLPSDFLKKPIILNVGRLNFLKGQDQLLKAWGNSSLSDIYNLLIIGGDLKQPNQEETAMLAFINNYLSENQTLENKFCHLAALSNDQVRRLEARIRAAQKDWPQIYLCASQKEEFGIAILEALSQKWLVLGPKKGGVKSYIENAVNGFLIDTNDWQSIAKDSEKILSSLKGQKKQFEKIQEAGKNTVFNNFSMEKIVRDFSSLYLSLKEQE